MQDISSVVLPFVPFSANPFLSYDHHSTQKIANIVHLEGRVNPAGRTPFTWARTREDYGADVLYEPNNGEGAPQQDFSEGVFIDYRYIDAKNATPIFEFGFGLSYTSFAYSDLRVEKLTADPYEATTGETAQAPTYGNFSEDLGDYLFPDGDGDGDDSSYIRRIYTYIYPYLNTTDAEAASGDPYYGGSAEDFLPPGAGASTAQPLHAAGPGPADQPGGNAGLFDALYSVTAQVTNTGGLPGDEVPQLYVSLGGADNPPRVLRGFDRLRGVAPGQTVVFSATLTRRDLSVWDTECQDWVVSDLPKTVYVGSSSRKLPLSAALA